MRKKQIQNDSKIPVRLSFKYMALVASITIFLSSVIFASLFLYVKSVRKAVLKESSEKIISEIQKDGVKRLAFIDLPYFIVYAVFEKDTKKVLSTNDRLLPLLDIPTETLSEYFESNFYSDGELKIVLYNQEIIIDQKSVVIECAMDIENDSLSKMMRGFPKILLACVLPIFIISFFISFLISRKTIEFFKELESAFEREKSFTSNVSHELKTPLSMGTQT